ncbi:MAG: nucleotidyltransferase family protein [Deltaproteobacteria bacterium]|nr:MAG: nucleotidyltransferase family protein [Deltaproteobacteria bacterium]
METIPGILLSAGSSIRFGSDKLLSLLPTGETLLERALRVHLQSQISSLIAVVSPNLGKILIENNDILSFSGMVIQERVDTWYAFWCRWGGGRLAINEKSQEGISSSIRKGLSCLQDEEKAGGLLISLSDLPLLTPQTINFFIKKFLAERAGILLPVFNGITGHPVIIDINRFKKDISKIKGDVGLRILIKKYPKMVKKIPWRDDSVTWDIDNPKDLERLL